MDIVLLHGYNVTSTRTYGVLPARLKNLGHNVKNLYLSKYITLDDDLTLPDLIKAFQAALEDVYGKNFKSKKFACITHSTGGLVARGWIDAYYAQRLSALPMTHLIMLAPPSYGSRLATVGRSKLSRIRQAFGVESGVQILDGLELGSQFQWDLASRWMRKKPHALRHFFPFVLTGQWIDRKIWDVLIPATFERGSDGVVRVASANINSQKFSIDADGRVIREVMGGVAFLVLPKISHTDTGFGIVGSIPKSGDHPTLEAIDAALRVKSRAAYQTLEADFALRTALLQRKDIHYDGSKLERYSQLIFRVVDDQGRPMPDYAIELIDANGRGDKLPTGFSGHQHKNERSPEFFTFYLNYDRIAKVNGGKLGFRVQAATSSPLVAYKPIEQLVEFTEVGRYLKPNQTTLVEVGLKRRLNKNVFRLTKNTGYQKIRGIPAEDWIE